MAEQEEIGAESASPVSTDATGTAAAIAAAVGRRGRARPKDDEALDEFLKEQTKLTRLQSEHLHEQRELVLSRLRWGRFSDRVKALLQVMTVIVGVAVVAFVGAMAWSAHEDRGLVVDAFSVPPDLARDGLTGQVAASLFLDRLQALQTATQESDRPAQSFQGNWGSDIKVEIPETGLTFDEFEKLLRERIGQVRHVTGEVVKTPKGIAVTARLGDAPPQTFEGPASDFDSLAQKAAEAVYRANQPYRYAEYLENAGRVDEAFRVISDLATDGPQSERGWAYSKWSTMDLNDHGDAAASARHATMGLGYGPSSDLQARIAQVNTAVWSGDEEADLKLSTLIVAMAQRRRPDTSQFLFDQNKLVSAAWLLFIAPDYRASAAEWERTLRESYSTHVGNFAPRMTATSFALNHDPAAARAAVAKAPSADDRDVLWDVATSAFLALPNYWIPAEEGNWRTALDDVRSVDEALKAGEPKRPIYTMMRKVWIWPLEALASARSGDVADAQALIDKTPQDCYLCLRVRGEIAAQNKDWAGAERWFAAAVRRAPSVSLAYSEWAQERLDSGNPTGAIALAKIAHAKAPRFADPLETWGDSLVVEHNYDGALDAFRKAGEIAPHWRRNRLAWAAARRLAQSTR